MMFHKIITFFIIVFIYSTTCSTSLSFPTEKEIVPDNDINSIVDSYVINNPSVPYIAQGNDSFCGFASIAMQINYYGYNTSLPEILHDTGHGYLRMYYKYMIPVSRLPSGGAGISSFTFNMDLLAEVYNLTYIDNSLYDVTNSASLWDEYYTKVKYYISNNLPVKTSVVSRYLSFWNSRFNYSGESSGGHAIVIVGYNETNNTICYNDPGAAIIDEAENGTYIWENQSVFKEAVEAMDGYYHISIFRKESEAIMSSRSERFEMVHEMNIKRLEGDFKYYFGVDIDPKELPLKYYLLFTLCYHMGINATKVQKEDIQSNLQQFITLVLYKNYNEKIVDPSLFYYDVFQQIENASSFLLKNRNLSDLCLHDGLLLQKEASLWKNLSFLVSDINRLCLNTNLIRAYLLAQSHFQKMNELLDEIIAIEEMILSNTL